MSQRISRGFHRLAIFLAAVPLLFGGAWVTFIAVEAKNKAHNETVELVCAQTALKKSQAYGAMIDAAGAEKQPAPQANKKLLFDDLVPKSTAPQTSAPPQRYSDLPPGYTLDPTSRSARGRPINLSCGKWTGVRSPKFTI